MFHWTKPQNLISGISLIQTFKMVFRVAILYVPEVLDGLGPDRELDGGADRPQLEELRRELVAHEAADVGVVAIRGNVGLRARRLGYLEEGRVGAHVADLEAREVDAVDVGLGRAQVVLRYAPQPARGKLELSFKSMSILPPHGNPHSIVGAHNHDTNLKF